MALLNNLTKPYNKPYPPLSEDYLKLKQAALDNYLKIRSKRSNQHTIHPTNQHFNKAKFKHQIEMDKNINMIQFKYPCIGYYQLKGFKSKVELNQPNHHKAQNLEAQSKSERIIKNILKKYKQRKELKENKQQHNNKHKTQWEMPQSIDRKSNNKTETFQNHHPNISINIHSIDTSHNNHRQSIQCYRNRTPIEQSINSFIRDPPKHKPHKITQ